MVLDQSCLQIGKTRLASNVYQMKDIFIISHSCKYSKLDSCSAVVYEKWSGCQEDEACAVERQPRSRRAAAAVLVECVELTPGHTKLVSIIG